MNRKKIAAVIGILIIIVAVVGIVIFLKNGSSTSSKTVSNTELSVDNETTETKEESDKQGNITGDTKEEKKDISGQDSSTDKTEKNNDNTDAEKSSGDNQAAQKENNVVENVISFPYEIADSGVKLKYLNGYSGIFVEDGSDEEVKNVAALLVENTSKKAIEYGVIKLKAGEKTLEFVFSGLPADSSVIVMEANGEKYDKSWKCIYEDSSFAYLDELSMLESDFEIKKSSDNSIVITNKTDEKIKSLRVFYKYQLDSGEYVGGITYTVNISDLDAKESRTIYPKHFSSDGSVIIMVRKYDE